MQFRKGWARHQFISWGVISSQALKWSQLPREGGIKSVDIQWTNFLMKISDCLEMRWSLRVYDLWPEANALTTINKGSRRWGVIDRYLPDLSTFECHSEPKALCCSFLPNPRVSSSIYWTRPGQWLYSRAQTTSSILAKRTLITKNTSLESQRVLSKNAKWTWEWPASKSCSQPGGLPLPFGIYAFRSIIRIIRHQFSCYNQNTLRFHISGTSSIWEWCHKYRNWLYLTL